MAFQRAVVTSREDIREGTTLVGVRFFFTLYDTSGATRDGTCFIDRPALQVIALFPTAGERQTARDVHLRYAMRATWDQWQLELALLPAPASTTPVDVSGTPEVTATDLGIT